jgi:hypothetical protein
MWITSWSDDSEYAKGYHDALRACANDLFQIMAKGETDLMELFRKAQS